MDLIKNKESNETVESTRGYLYNVPETDIFEDKEKYTITFDLPGIEKEDINVKIEKDILSITAETKKQPLDSYETLREEMEFEGFQRSFNLNGIVDPDKINADFKNGTLKLTLPKKEEQKTREIQIKVS
jgi:HSP20 family protein